MKPIDRYKQLIEQLLSGSIDAEQFEAAFLESYKADPTEWTDDQFNALEQVFFAVDRFCADPDLRDEDDLDVQQLRSEVARALRTL